MHAALPISIAPSDAFASALHHRKTRLGSQNRNSLSSVSVVITGTLGHIAELITVPVLQALEILFLDELINGFLDIGHFGREAGFDLVDGFLDEDDVLHLLAGLHDADDSRLGGILV